MNKLYMAYSDKPLIDGDIISVDCGALKNNYYGDRTFAIGEISEIKKLLTITKESLYLGIEQMIVGNRIGDISYAVQNQLKRIDLESFDNSLVMD